MEIRNKVYTKESAKKISIALIQSYQTKPELRSRLSNRMTLDNPMFNQKNIEKMKLNRGKYTFLSRGGNGKMTSQQLKLFSTISGITEMYMEFSIPISKPLKEMNVTVESTTNY